MQHQHPHQVVDQGTGDDSGFGAPFLLDIRKDAISPFKESTNQNTSPSAGFPAGVSSDRRPSLADRRRSSRTNPYTLRSAHEDSQDGPIRFPTSSTSDPSKLGPETVEQGGAGWQQQQQGWMMSNYSHSRSSSISSISSATSSWSDVESIRMTANDIYSQHVPGMAANFTFPTLPAPAYGNAFANVAGPVSTQPNLENGGDYDISAYVEALRNHTGTNSQNEKIKIAFVHKWLNQSFYLHPEGNVSRQALYGSYIYICEQYGITPINAASYGKAVRSCWPGIKTRRLGVRSCSHYHYCGIRPASRAIEEIVNMANADGSTGIGPPVGMKQNYSTSAASSSHSISPSSSIENIASIPLLPPNGSSGNNSPFKTESESDHSPIDLPTQPTSGGSDEDFHSLRRQASAPSLIPIPQNVNSNNPSPLPDFAFPDLKTPTAPHFLSASALPHTLPSHNNATAAAAAAYLEKGRRATFPNLQIAIPPLRPASAPDAPAARVSSIPEAQAASGAFQLGIPYQQINLQLPTFEEIMARAPQIGLRSLDRAVASNVWSTYKTEHCQVIVKLVANGHFEQYETTLKSFWERLDNEQQRVCQHPILSDALYTADTVVFDALLKNLNEGVLQPSMAGFQDKLQNLANHLESWTAESLKAFPSGFAGFRVELASRTAHLINRHLGIAQLAQALNGIFSRSGTIDEMIAAWDTINFDAITNQAALVTSCTQQTVSYYLEEFKRAMLGAGSDPVKAFAAFADATLAFALAKEPNNRPAESRSRDFLLKWNYIVSQITRDLTIRSNSTFGSFQILSLFIQEWLAFKILKDAALHAHAVAASVNAEEAGSRQMQMMHDTSTYLVSPAASGFLFPEVPRSAKFNPALSAGHPNTLAPPGLGSVPGLSYNFASSLSPTTRAIFGDTSKTPVYYNFGHLPPTPSALQMQRSPGLRPPMTFPTMGGTYSFDDLTMPLASPARMNYLPFR